ncbi:acyl dehydratase [Streptomyces sp. NPDC046203]|uniref:acyl dehydratase n=1 Tax=Streptomyces sp. NPDC046203 TaxID=3154602 RepID=UPI0033CFC1DB
MTTDPAGVRAAPVRGTARVRPGDTLAPLVVPVTRTLVVAGAIAARDYQDVHHDAERAREKGSPDIFMNILTTNGLVGRYITDRFGPRAVLRAVSIRLGAPNYPGDTMTLTGTVTEVDGATVRVRVVGANGLGHHVTGTVTVDVPTEPKAPADPPTPEVPEVPPALTALTPPTTLTGTPGPDPDPDPEGPR